MLSYFAHNKGPNVFYWLPSGKFLLQKNLNSISPSAERRELWACTDKGWTEEAFCFVSFTNGPCRIKLCSLAELLPTQAVKNKDTVKFSFNSHQTCGGSHLRHLQGFTDLLRPFWPPVFINSLTDQEKNYSNWNLFKDQYHLDCFHLCHAVQ